MPTAGSASEILTVDSRTVTARQRYSYRPCCSASSTLCSRSPSGRSRSVSSVVAAFGEPLWTVTVFGRFQLRRKSHARRPHRHVIVGGEAFFHRRRLPCLWLGMQHHRDR